jgi:hypothetical protein
MAGSGVSLFPGVDLTSRAGFEAWVRRLVRQGDPAAGRGGRLVPVRDTSMGRKRRYWITLG